MSDLENLSEDELRQLELAREAGGLTDQAEADYQFLKHPPLVEGADPKMVLDLPGENLIQMYYEWGSIIQDAYPEYHAFNMLVFLSYIVPAKMQPRFGDVYNNIWGIILGDSGTSGKSSTVKELIRISYTNDLRGKINRMPDKPTPEAFAEVLQEHPHRFWVIDEAAGFMKFLKRDYASELQEDLCKAYDHTDFSKKKVRKKQDEGLVQVINPHVSILWDTVPESFSKNVTLDKFEDGFYLRPLYLIPQREKPIKRDEVASLETRTMRAAIISRIRELIDAVEAHPGQEIISKENEILNTWKHEQREKLHTIKSDIKRSARTRSFEHARKIAMVLTIASVEFLSELEQAPKMSFAKKPDSVLIPYELSFTIPDWAAIKAIEWMDGVFIPYFDQAFKIANANAGLFSKVQRLLNDGGWVSRMQIADMTRKHGRALDEFLTEFDIMSTIQDKGGKGHPVTYYKLRI